MITKMYDSDMTFKTRLIIVTIILTIIVTTAYIVWNSTAKERVKKVGESKGVIQCEIK